MYSIAASGYAVGIRRSRAGMVLVTRQGVQTSAESDRGSEIGSLIVAGDQACADGDLGTLDDIAQRLAELFTEPRHCELLAFANGCRSDPERASAAWEHLKALVEQSVR
jgi:hypothetical protein